MRRSINCQRSFCHILVQPGSRCHLKKSLNDVKFAVNLKKSVRFALNAINAVKKLLSGEKFLFTAYAAKKNHR